MFPCYRGSTHTYMLMLKCFRGSCTQLLHVQCHAICIIIVISQKEKEIEQRCEGTCSSHIAGKLVGFSIRTWIFWTPRPALIPIVALLNWDIKLKLTLYVHMYLSAYNFLMLWGKDLSHRHLLGHRHNSKSPSFSENVFRVLIKAGPTGIKS